MTATRDVVWLERVGAAILAPFALAVIFPSIAPNDTSRMAALGYIAFAAGTVICIFVGSKRFQPVRWIGWTLLLIFVVIAFRE